MRFAKTLCSLIAALALASCAAQTPLQPEPARPLTVANCPDLTPLEDDSMGSWVLKAMEWAAQYKRCQAAASDCRNTDKTR